MSDPIAPIRAAVAGRYEIEREIGQGAFATVYLARDLRHDRRVAFKVLNADPSSENSELRFLREIRLLARLQHPNILPLIDSGHAEAMLYYVMPYVSGESLRDRIHRERQVPIEFAISVAREVADALACAHDQGIIHRDIKPENILLSGGHPIIADFGVARAIDLAGVRQLTRTGLGGSPGTPAYMSPEQLMGDREVDRRSDIYSLGCVLFEMLTGSPPFAGKDGFVKRFTEPPPHASAARRNLPLEFDGIVAKALAREPAERYASGVEFARELSKAQFALGSSQGTSGALSENEVVPELNASVAVPSEAVSSPGAHMKPRASRKFGGRGLVMGVGSAPPRRRSLLVAGGFAVAAAVAGAIVTARPRPTSNALLAQQAFVRGNLDAIRFRSPEDMRRAVKDYTEATTRDPDLAVAFARLAQVQSALYNDVDRTAARKDDAKMALDRALALDPSSPDTRLALGFYTYWVARQRDSAIVYLEAAQALQQENAELLSAVGTMFRTQGRWPEALTTSRRAATLDPRSPRYAFDVAITELWMGRFADADRDIAHAIALRPDYLPPYLSWAMMQVVWKGDIPAAHRVLGEALRQRTIDTATILKALVPRFRPLLPILSAPWQRALARLSLRAGDIDPGAYYLAIAELRRRRSDRSAARAFFDSARAVYAARIRGDPLDPILHSELGFSYAGLGRVRDAKREADLALRLVPLSEDVIGHAFGAFGAVRTFLLLGDYDAAMDELQRGDAGSLISRAYLQVHPDFAVLRGLPRFRALLAQFR